MEISHFGKVIRNRHRTQAETFEKQVNNTELKSFNLHKILKAITFSCNLLLSQVEKIYKVNAY